MKRRTETTAAVRAGREETGKHKEVDGINVYDRSKVD